MSECTVIIPVIKINNLLVDVVKNIHISDKNLKIIIIYKNYSDLIKPTDKISLYQSDIKNMSAKRNFGVIKSDTKYIAFLDSDAYPDNSWFINAKSFLEKDLSIGIITGPEISFPNQSFTENLIGIINKSFLITGSHSFRKSYSKSRYYEEASSCNIIMRKEDYLKIGGMDPNRYLGEDQEFSHRLTDKLKKKIYFSNKVIVFHKDRGIRDFFWQRYSRGVTADSLFSRLKEFFKNITFKNFIKQRFEIFIPFFFIIFLFSSILIFFIKVWKYFFLSFLMLYFFIIIYETLRLTKKKLRLFFPILILLIIGTIIPGTSRILDIFNIQLDPSKFYRNENDK